MDLRSYSRVPEPGVVQQLLWTFSDTGVSHSNTDASNWYPRNQRFGWPTWKTKPLFQKPCMPMAGKSRDDVG